MLQPRASYITQAYIGTSLWAYRVCVGRRFPCCFFNIVLFLFLDNALFAGHELDSVGMGASFE